ncbi:MAG: ATP-binding cassette domain-containing protein, partial [Planctomycetes bacterium]|nr:ATP-binding cassette domain-containing protein [Planctomycetota bacterium]
REVSLSHYRKQIGIVAQETFLFDDTIYNNIAYGSPEAKTEDIFLAAQRSFADGFIEQLPDGYETRVGEKGMLLSGGQRQRIALARAMLRNPSILILDEATSALDLESEHLIHQALQSFIKDRTTIIITHRLQTLTLATRIVVMENGTICSTGTHEKLVQESPLYQRLHEIHIQQPPSYAKHTTPSRPLPTVERGSESGTDTF